MAVALIIGIGVGVVRHAPGTIFDVRLLQLLLMRSPSFGDVCS